MAKKRPSLPPRPPGGGAAVPCGIGPHARAQAFLASCVTRILFHTNDTRRRLTYATPEYVELEFVAQMYNFMFQVEAFDILSRCCVPFPLSLVLSPSPSRQPILLRGPLTPALPPSPATREHGSCSSS